MSEFVQAGIFTVMVVRVEDPNEADFESKLAERVARSPAFFANAPVVLDLRDCVGLATADGFRKLCALFKRQHMMAVGIQNGNATQVRAAMNADLAAFPASGSRRADTASAEPPAAAAAPVAPASRTRIVSLPVRSGSQIYARGSDVTVLAAVSPGAEIIADGNVHIYGALRGRAVAGAAGDVAARIFVSKLEAELLCIAGHYLVSEAIEPRFRGQAVQVALIDERIALSLL